jgi:metal-responsive CopG/Arc/MetJ family transcriptional regulator
MSVKYTTVLSRECLNELKALTDKKIIPSVSQGIRWAVENFVDFQKKQAYEDSMKSAALDAEFIKRNIETQNDFTVVDAEGEGSW